MQLEQINHVYDIIKQIGQECVALLMLQYNYKKRVGREETENPSPVSHPKESIDGN